MKGVGLQAGEDGEKMSDRKVKRIAKDKLAADKDKTAARRLEAQVGALGGAMKGIGLGGEATKDKATGKEQQITIQADGESVDPGFGTGFSNNLRGAFN